MSLRPLLLAVAGFAILTLVVVGLYDSERLSFFTKSGLSDFECYQQDRWSGCSLPATPYMLITSDIHLSSSDGRWPETTGQFVSFLKKISKSPPELIFIVGDIVDNATENYPGSLSNWKKEWQIYESIKEAHEDIEFRQSYGTGHDWLNDEMLETLDQETGPRHGIFSWRDINFVWLSFGPGAYFPEAEEYHPDLGREDMLWLESILAGVDRASLMFHVPVSTERSRELGTFSGGRLIVLDPRDPLYQALDAHQEKIDFIFNGHIHETFRHEYNSIEMFSCPFKDARSFCTIEVSGGNPEVQRFRVRSETGLN